MVSGTDTFALVPIAAISSANTVKVVSDGCKEVLDSCWVQIRDLKKIQSNCEAQVKIQEKIIEDVTVQANEVVQRNNQLKKQNKNLRNTTKVLTGTSLLLLILVLL